MRRRKTESSSDKESFWEKDSRFRGFDPEDCDRSLAKFFISGHFMEDLDELEDYMDSIYSGAENLTKDAASYVLAYVQMGELIRSMFSKGSKSYRLGAKDALADYLPSNWR